MQKSINTPYGVVSVGTRLRITDVKVESTMFPDGIDRQALEMKGKTGTVKCIDDMNQIFGDWGGLALLPDQDEFVILN